MLKRTPELPSTTFHLKIAVSENETKVDQQDLSWSAETIFSRPHQPQVMRSKRPQPTAPKPKDTPKDFLESLQRTASCTPAKSEEAEKKKPKHTFVLDPKWTSGTREELLEMLMEIATAWNASGYVRKVFRSFQSLCNQWIFSQRMNGSQDSSVSPNLQDLHSISSSGAALQCGSAVDPGFDAEIGSGTSIPISKTITLLEAGCEGGMRRGKQDLQKRHFRRLLFGSRRRRGSPLWFLGSESPERKRSKMHWTRK